MKLLRRWWFLLTLLAYSMQQVLCHGAVSVHLSVPAIDRCRGGVSAAGQAGRRHRSIAAWPAPSSNGATAARRTAARWSAAKASSVTFTAAVGG